MPATASMTDVSRTDFTKRNDSFDQRKSGVSQAQCSPVPLPALGTQRIIQGNGTTVGTVISLQCPAKHRLVGSEMMCVMDNNSTYWTGETYCKPLSRYEDFGFRVAVLASIVSLTIILLMSMAFITCCLLDCIRKDKKKNEEMESDVWQYEERAQNRENSRPHYHHIGRNNNNNNSQDKVFTLWDSPHPPVCASVQVCRCHHLCDYSSASTYGPAPPPSALCGHESAQPLLTRSLECVQLSSPPSQCLGPPGPCYRTVDAGLDQVSSAWQAGQQQQQQQLCPTHRYEVMNTSPAKEFPIRILRV